MVKKMLILVIFLLAPFIVFAYPQGDVNGDGKVSSADYIKIKKHIMGMTKLSGAELTRADANNDGKVSSADYITVKKTIMYSGSESNNNNNTNNSNNNNSNNNNNNNKVDLTSADSICESVKNNSYIDYKSFVTLNKKDNDSDKYKDDYYAIRAAHDCANKYNKPVKVTKGEYHIYKRNSSKVTVKTSTDFNGSKIYIHDESGIVLKGSGIIGYVYYIAHDNCAETTTMKLSGLKEGNTVSKLAGSSNGRWVEVVDESRKVFIRYGGGGANANNGHGAIDAFRVDKNGKILDPLFWEYDNKKIQVTMCDIPKDTLTFKNGSFYTIVAKVSTTYTDKHFRRGIQVSRSNTILDNINHTYVDSNLKKVSTINYNYYAFLRFQDASNIVYKNSKVQAMKNYHGNKHTFIYDFGIYDVTNIEFNNIVSNDYDGTKKYFSKSSNQLKDDLWGIMGAGDAKNVVFDKCVLNRIDAHEFFYNLTIKNSKLGYWGVNVDGYGTLKIENTDVYYTNRFIYLRGDYGSVWKGDVIIKDSALHATSASSVRIIDYAFVTEGGSTTIHNYGYDLYLPNVKVTNFKVYGGASSIKVFTSDSKLRSYTIKGGKYKLHYPSSSNIKVSGVTNASGKSISVSNGI